MGKQIKPAGKKFDFKIKIARTDLASREYLLGAESSFGFDGDPAMYQNSGYISKLWFINNYPGGIPAKDKVEDMPERYRRFVGFGSPSETRMIKDFQKEMAMLSKREQIGQNVFYSQLPAQPNREAPGKKESKKPPQNAENEKYAEIAGSFDGIAAIENFREFIEDALYGEADLEDGYEEDEEYEAEEEIRDILQLNNVYNSEIYKMSKVKYDFSASGHISRTKEGMFDIEYDETETTGIEGSCMRILFSENNRDIVTFHSKSFFDEWFTLEKGKRVSIERIGASFGAVTSATAKELSNSITLEGGQLRAVYAMEINGVPSETVSYSIKAKLADDKKTK